MNGPRHPFPGLAAILLAMGLATVARAQTGPAYDDPAFARARGQWQQGQQDAARESLRILCEAHPDDGRVWIAVAHFLVLERAFADALPYSERAVALAPDQVDSFLLLTECQVESGDTEAAEATMQAAVDRFPDDALLQFQLGTTRALNRKILEARECFVEAVRLEPSNARYQYTLGGSYAHTNEFEAAERHLLRACRGKNKHPDAPWQLAQVLAFQNRPDEAETWFRKALSLPDNKLYQPSLQNARYQYAVFLYEQRRPAEAEPLLEQFLAKAQEDRMAWMYLARVQNALGQRDAAQESMQRYRELQAVEDAEENRYLLGLIENLRQTRRDPSPEPDDENRKPPDREASRSDADRQDGRPQP